jgi:hypothetical protein
MHITGTKKIYAFTPEYFIFMKHVFKGLIPTIWKCSESPDTIAPKKKHVITYIMTLLSGFRMPCIGFVLIFLK